jgi:transcription initiation factor IIE alpha subunit
MASNRSRAASLSDTEYLQSLLDALVRYAMQTFYETPKSYIFRYIYQQGSVTERELALHLHLTPKLTHQHLEDLKRDRLIIRKDSGQSSTTTTGFGQFADLSYRVDILAFVDLVRLHLVKMRIEIEEGDHKRIETSMNYTCKECVTEYTPSILSKFFDARRDTVSCPKCGGAVHENNLTDEEIIPMRLFNQQMTPLYDILQKIDQIGTDEVIRRCLQNRHNFNQNPVSTAACLENKNVRVILEPDELASTVPSALGTLPVSILQRPKKTDSTSNKGLPPWFTIPCVPDDDHRVDAAPADDLPDALDRAKEQHAAKLQEIRELLRQEFESKSKATPVLSEIDERSGRSPLS